MEDLIIPTAAVSGWAGLPEFSNFHGTFGPNFKFDPENSKKAAKNWKRVNVYHGHLHTNPTSTMVILNPRLRFTVWGRSR
jgi:hypothetical protein